MSKTNTSYTYDTKLGKWVPKTEVSLEESVTLTESNTSTTTPPTGTKSDSEEKTEKKYREIEYSTLEGEISLIPTVENMQIKAGDTVTLKGVGNFLSGKYFVTNVKRTINDSDGYSQTLTVIKTGFGDSLKQAETKATSTNRAKAVTTSNVVAGFNVGDKVKVIGDNAIYSNANEGDKVPNWVKNMTLTISKLSENGDRALLKEVFSWTYTKYLKQV